MSERVAKYAIVQVGERLYQGEIVEGLIQVRQTLETIGAEGPPRLDEIRHPFAIVMTQDCDLEQDFRLRFHAEGGSPALDNILFCEAIAATVLKGQVSPGKDIWKRVIQNKDERYECLESVPPDQDLAGAGIPCLGCDFKRFFTVPTDEVYRRLELGQIQRRTRLITPYAEHLLSRFCIFQSRVPLPQNHEVPL